MQPHGWLVVDKPLHVTSADVVSKARKALKTKKIGHAGTLDPLASGVLPLAVGVATKTIPYAMDGEKRYRFHICFGAQTTTDDKEGVVIATSTVLPDEAAIHAVLPQFIGEVMQLPPQFSALKINGKRAYELARRGEMVALTPRPVMIHDLQFIQMVAANEAEFTALVGKGTYIRALARDIAQSLGSVGHVSLLRRETVGKFTLEHAISLDFLDKAVHNAEAFCVKERLQPVMVALAGIPAHALSAAQWHAISHGQVIHQAMPVNGTVALTYLGELRALAEADSGMIKPKRVFHDSSTMPE